MAPLIRRRPLSERIKAYLDPYDWLLWLSEKIDLDDLDDALKDQAFYIGFVFNVVFMVAISNSSGPDYADIDDVFGDSPVGGGSGWFHWLCTFVVHLLTLLSCTNAFHAFYRTRSYRLFENPVDKPPRTPSARRVRVDSSPGASTPLRFLSNILGSPNAEARAHSDPTTHVWELDAWYPRDTCLRLYCTFSPGHVAVYWLLFSLSSVGSRLSMKVATAIPIASLMTAQLCALNSSWTRQRGDRALVNSQVAHEYDTKFVHPNLNTPVRNVGTQMVDGSTDTNEVDASASFTKTIKGFHTYPNTAYARHYDRDNQFSSDSPVYRTTARDPPTTPHAFQSYASSPLTAGAQRSPSQHTPRRTVPANLTKSQGYGGGSLGVRDHAASPLQSPLDLKKIPKMDPSGIKRGQQGLKSRRPAAPV